MFPEIWPVSMVPIYTVEEIEMNSSFFLNFVDNALCHCILCVYLSYMCMYVCMYVYMCLRGK